MAGNGIRQTVCNTILPNELVQAIGNDLLHLPTFKKSLNDKFVKRSYTVNEIEYCEKFSDPLLRYASTWAAKESVYKAIKQLLPEVSIWWRSIEIKRDKPSGKPSVSIKGIEKNYEIKLTITHDGEYVWALAFVSFIRDLTI